MLQHEFESLVGMSVDYNEYIAINAVYENGDVEKDEFCRLWVKMNHKRVKCAKAEAKAQKQFKAMPIEEQVITKMLELAQARSNETGSEYPLSDTQFDTEFLRREHNETESFMVYLVLRDTGADIRKNYTVAVERAKVFSNCNARIYTFYGNRSLNFGYYMECGKEDTKKTF